jgi:hypothetical protein
MAAAKKRRMAHEKLQKSIKIGDPQGRTKSVWWPAEKYNTKCWASLVDQHQNAIHNSPGGEETYILEHGVPVPIPEDPESFPICFELVYFANQRSISDMLDTAYTRAPEVADPRAKRRAQQAILKTVKVQRTAMKGMKAGHDATKAQLQASQAELQTEKTDHRQTNAQLQASQAELQTEKTDHDATKAELQTVQNDDTSQMSPLAPKQNSINVVGSQISPMQDTSNFKVLGDATLKPVMGMKEIIALGQKRGVPVVRWEVKGTLGKDLLAAAAGVMNICIPLGDRIIIIAMVEVRTIENQKIWRGQGTLTNPTATPIHRDHGAYLIFKQQSGDEAIISFFLDGRCHNITIKCSYVCKSKPGPPGSLGIVGINGPKDTARMLMDGLPSCRVPLTDLGAYVANFDSVCG